MYTWYLLWSSTMVDIGGLEKQKLGIVPSTGKHKNTTWSCEDQHGKQLSGFLKLFLCTVERSKQEEEKDILQKSVRSPETSLWENVHVAICIKLKNFHQVQSFLKQDALWVSMACTRGCGEGREKKSPLVLICSFKSSLNSHQGVRYKTRCSLKRQEMKFQMAASELTELIEAGCRQTLQVSLSPKELQSRPGVFYINKSYTWQNTFLSKFLWVYMGLLSNYNLL